MPDQSWVITILVGIIGSLLGFLFAYMMKITKLSSRNSAMSRDIKTLYRDNDKQDKDIELGRNDTQQTHKLLTEVVSQNNLLIQKIIATE